MEVGGAWGWGLLVRNPENSVRIIDNSPDPQGKGGAGRGMTGAVGLTCLGRLERVALLCLR